jgi:hypothetical protein
MNGWKKAEKQNRPRGNFLFILIDSADGLISCETGARLNFTLGNRSVGILNGGGSGDKR